MDREVGGMTDCSADAGGEAPAEDTVHVALSTNLKKGRLILDWTFKHFRGKQLVLVHIHKPPKRIPMKMGGKFPIDMVSREEAEPYIEEKRGEMNTMVDTYMRFCTSHNVPDEVSTKKLVLEMGDVFTGIVYLVGQHRIKRLVLGLRSMKGQPVLDEGLLSCQICLVYRGKLVFSRDAMLQKITIDFTGEEKDGSSTPSAKSVRETSSVISASTSRSSYDASSSKSSKEISESRQYSANLGTSGSWTTESVEETLDCIHEVEQTKTPSSNEDYSDAEDFRELLVNLSQAVNVVHQQRLNLASQMLVLKQEFIEFSLPELEAATDKYLAKQSV